MVKLNQFSDLVGQTLVACKTNSLKTRDESIDFYLNDGSVYSLIHWQSCCETVDLEDINGDLDDLVNTPILVAEERSNMGENEDSSLEYTFYTLRTIKGSVDIRWVGDTDSYYSVEVSFDETTRYVPDAK